MTTPVVQYGNFRFDWALPAPQYSGMRLEELFRPGLDGVAWRELGKYPDPFQMPAFVYFSTASAANGTFENLRAAQGTYSNLVDIFSYNHGLYMLLKVDKIETVKQDLFFSGGYYTSAGAAYCLKVALTLQFAGQA